MAKATTQNAGFTLVELSIVLVIVGLIVGGVLAGQDLIRSAMIRAQLSQFERYAAATNTFRGKYDNLPGDIPEPKATQLGFKTRMHPGGIPRSDGNGVIQGTCDGAACRCGFCVGSGEGLMYWVDLSTANLIDGGFNTSEGDATVPAVTGQEVKAYFPTAKIGGSNFVYVWSSGVDGGWLSPGDGINYMGISAVTQLDGWSISSNTGLTILEALTIDTKLDDGKPQSGNVQAWYYNVNLSTYRPVWAAGGGDVGAGTTTPDPNTRQAFTTTAAVPAADTNCYDNRNTAGDVQSYSVITSANAGLKNCALSIRF